MPRRRNRIITGGGGVQAPGRGRGRGRGRGKFRIRGNIGSRPSKPSSAAYIQTDQNRFPPGFFKGKGKKSPNFRKGKLFEGKGYGKGISGPLLTSKGRKEQKAGAPVTKSAENLGEPLEGPLAQAIQGQLAQIKEDIGETAEPTTPPKMQYRTKQMAANVSTKMRKNPRAAERARRKLVSKRLRQKPAKPQVKRLRTAVTKTRPTAWGTMTRAQRKAWLKAQRKQRRIKAFGNPRGGGPE